MKKDPTSRLRHAEAQDQHAAEQQSTHHDAAAHQHAAKGLEFAEVDDLIRFDAGQVAPPERIAVRLGESLAHSPPRKLSWWERLLSRAPSD